MALARVKVWIAETLTAADLNAEVNNILNNALSLISPLTGSLDWDGFAHTLDAAAVTTAQSTAAIGWTFSPGAKSGTPGTTGGIQNWAASTWTDNNTAASGTAASWTGHSLQRPTLAATNATVTTTDAATLYIVNSPAEGTNETITNEYALWIDDGRVRLDLTSSIPSAAGATCRSLYLPAATQVITGSTGITTTAGYNYLEVERPTMSAASALTITNSATLYIANAPLGGGAGPATITNPYALWADDGEVRFDAGIELTGTITGTYTLGGTPTISGATISGAAPATPTAGVFYSDQLVRVWVNFDGTGAPVIRDDLNVSSLTDNGVGDYTVTFATAMGNTNYVAVPNIGHTVVGDNQAHVLGGGIATGSVQIVTAQAGIVADFAQVYLIVFGDQ